MEFDMKTLLKAASLASVSTFIASHAFACDPNSLLGSQGCGGGTPVNVPEISAMEGTAALAVLAAVVLLVWERRRAA